MPNMMQRGASWLGGKLQTAAGREVTYARRSQSFTVTGWPAKVDYEVDDEDGIPRKVSFYDWTFTAAELDFGDDDEVFASRPGDLITEILNGNEITYEPMPPGTRPISEWADASGVLVLIHTKIVKCQPSS